LLLVGGGDDVLFTEVAERKVVERICAAGGHVQKKMYPGLGHDALVYGSFKDQLEWIAQRFRGESTPNECHSKSPT
jgi:acetyl esterase/lipase